MVNLGAYVSNIQYVVKVLVPVSVEVLVPVHVEVLVEVSVPKPVVLVSVV